MITRYIGCCALATVAVAALSGCGKSDKTAAANPVTPPEIKLPSGILPSGQEAEYFPYAVGNQWSYEAETAQGANGRSQTRKSTVTYKIEKVSDAAGGGKFIQWSTFEDGKKSDSEVWLINKKGIYQYAAGTKRSRLSTPQLMLGFPVKPGKKEAWKGTVVNDKGESRKLNVTWLVNGEEEVDAANKTYNAIKITGTGNVTAPSMKADLAEFLWFAPKTGIVRRRTELVGETKVQGQTVRVSVIRLLRLKNFTPKT